MNPRFSLFSILISLCISVFAAKPIDEAKAAYARGDFESAITQLQTIIKRTPKDGTAYYYLGLSKMAMGQEEEATKALLKAEERGIGDASRLLTELALRDYHTADAEEHLDNWSTALRKAKKSIPEEFNEFTARLVMLKNMLERVEKIEIIDSISVDSANFFAAYPLSPEAGKLLSASVLPPQYSRSGVRMAFRPQSGREILWSMPDSTGVYSLMSAGILDDGTMETPSHLGYDATEGEEADFPFLMPDGITLYFAATGENSLGGYDIFMTRRNDDGTLMQPQNMGMPYNSTANDFMLAIDETTGLGWWATDRNAEPGKVTIYTFIPSDTRVNYDPDDSEITQRALISSIASTQIPGKDYKSILERAYELAKNSSESATAQSGFFFPLPNGKVISSVDELSQPRAQQALKQWLQCRANYNHARAALKILRQAYAGGNLSAADEILRLESQLPTLQSEMQKVANQVVRYELNIR